MVWFVLNGIEMIKSRDGHVIETRRLSHNYLAYISIDFKHIPRGPNGVFRRGMGRMTFLPQKLRTS